MKYQKIYDALQTGGARIDLDQSGWRANSSDNGLPAMSALACGRSPQASS
ncbi:MAG: hypothetical protein ACLUES_11955 [Flavonifractor plautii]